MNELKGDAQRDQLADRYQKACCTRKATHLSASQVFFGKLSSSGSKDKPKKLSVWATTLTHLGSIEGSPPRGGKPRGEASKSGRDARGLAKDAVTGI